MRSEIVAFTLACTLVLSACGSNSSENAPTAEQTTTAETTQTDTDANSTGSSCVERELAAARKDNPDGIPSMLMDAINEACGVPSEESPPAEAPTESESAYASAPSSSSSSTRSTTPSGPQLLTCSSVDCTSADAIEEALRDAWMRSRGSPFNDACYDSLTTFQQFRANGGSDRDAGIGADTTFRPCNQALKEPSY